MGGVSGVTERQKEQTWKTNVCRKMSSEGLVTSMSASSLDFAILTNLVWCGGEERTRMIRKGEERGAEERERGSGTARPVQQRVVDVGTTASKMWCLRECRAWGTSHHAPTTPPTEGGTVG